MDPRLVTATSIVHSNSPEWKGNCCLHSPDCESQIFVVLSIVASLIRNLTTVTSIVHLHSPEWKGNCCLHSPDCESQIIVVLSIVASLIRNLTTVTSIVHLHSPEWKGNCCLQSPDCASQMTVVLSIVAPLIRNYNQGEKSLARLSLFSSIHPITALNLSFWSLVRWNRNPELLSWNRIPPSHPLSQCCAQQ